MKTRVMMAVTACAILLGLWFIARATRSASTAHPSESDDVVRSIATIRTEVREQLEGSAAQVLLPDGLPTAELPAWLPLLGDASKEPPHPM